MCFGRKSGPTTPAYESIKLPRGFSRRGFTFDNFDKADPQPVIPAAAGTAGYNPFATASAAQRKSILGVGA